jgi:hypothetical protein
MKESEKIYQVKIIGFTSEGKPIRKLVCINCPDVKTMTHGIDELC